MSYCGCVFKNGYFTLFIFVFPSSFVANCNAFSACLSIRKCNVSKLFVSTHALNALSDGPVFRINKYSSLINLLLPTTTPPSTLPCPSKNFVAECTTRSAPKLIGCCTAGVAKQLSTTNKILRGLQMADNNSISIIFNPGLEGVSTYSIFVFGFRSASIVSGISISKYEYSIPHFGKYFVSMV